jgi:hypothetical protein
VHIQAVTTDDASVHASTSRSPVGRYRGFEQRLLVVKGPSGGVRSGYSTVHSYLDKNLFHAPGRYQLHRQRGIATDMVHGQVMRIPDGMKALGRRNPQQ